MTNDVLISSFFAGSLQTIVGHPFDTIKTRMQIYNVKANTCIIDIYKKEGITSFYKGALSPLVVGSIQNCMSFSIENYFKKYSNNSFITGFISGGINSFFTTPAELIKCHIQNEKRKHLNFKETMIILKQKKINFHTGLVSTFIRESIGCSIYFGSYNNLKEKYDNPLLNGGIAGVLGWLYSYPIDVIKTKKQITNESYSKIISKLKFNNYFQGLGIMLFRSFFTNGCIFFAYENLKESML